MVTVNMSVADLLNNTITNATKSIYEENKEIIWLFGGIYILVALVAIIGNGLVLYAAHSNRNLGRLRNFDGAIKSLAIADMLFGLVGIPCRIFGTYYIGTVDNIQNHE